MDDYQKIVKKQIGRKAQLEARVRDLEAILTLEEHGSVNQLALKNGNESNGNNQILKGSLKRQDIYFVFDFFIF